MIPKPEQEEHKGQPFEIYGFSVPMMHEDWHTAEEMGLVYAGYLHHGPDYWDDVMVFTKPEHEHIAQDWLTDW